MDSTEVPAGSPGDAVERFAQEWWDSASDGAPPMLSAPPERASTVVIRAERV
jgi:hypothetical protein